MVSSLSGSRSLQDLSEMQNRMSGRLDQDGSGGLDVGEFSKMLANAPNGAPQTGDAASTFASLDANSDGSLSQTEFDAGMSSLPDASQSTVARFGGGPPPGPPPTGDGGSSDDQTLQKLLAMLTSSDDGSTSLSSSSSTTSDTSAAGVSASDDAQAMAKKLSQMFEQMAQAFASAAGQPPGGFSVNA